VANGLRRAASAHRRTSASRIRYCTAAGPGPSLPRQARSSPARGPHAFKEIQVSPKKTKPQQPGMKRFYLVLGVIAVLGIAAIAFTVVRSRAGGAALEPVTIADSTDSRALYERATGMQIGSATAPVKIVVFSDYQCPYCGQFASTIKPALVNEFINAGKLQFVYYDFPLGGTHKYSFIAARAARCAGDQNKFWEYHDLLFGQQSEWSFSTGVPMAEFQKYATQAGVDGAAFEACLKSDKHADVVTANRMLGDQLGVNATPTVIINNRRVVSPLDSDEISKLIRESGV
jgi:protein-disulfide isomerase